MLVFHFGKSATVSVFARFPSAFCVCVRRNQSCYLAFRTTKVKDIKLTPSSYSILSRIKELFKFFSVTNIRGKSCRVSIPVKIYNSLVQLREYVGVVFAIRKQLKHY